MSHCSASTVFSPSSRNSHVVRRSQRPSGASREEPDATPAVDSAPSTCSQSPAVPQADDIAVRCPHCEGRLVGKMPSMSAQRVWGVLTIRLAVRFMPTQRIHRPEIMAAGLMYGVAVNLATDLNERPRKKAVSYKVVRTGTKPHAHGVVKLDQRCGTRCRIDLKYLTFDEARHHARRFNLERTEKGATTLWSFVLAPEPIGVTSD